MVKIAAIPPQPVVAAFHGVIDFACWKGRPYARSWPRRPTMPRSPTVQDQVTSFSTYARTLQLLDHNLYLAAKAQAAGSRWTYKDYLYATAWGHVWL